MVTITYPGVRMKGVQDTSSGSRSVNTTIPLHLPLFFIVAEKGPVGVPTLCDQATAYAVFGENTFDPTKKFFNHQQIFAKYAMGYQQVYLVRLADSTVSSAGVVLEATLKKTDITQYQKDTLGNRVIDAATKQPVPRMQADGTTPLTEPGYSILFSTRALAAGETYDSLKTSTTGSGNTLATTYPILAASASTPGTAGLRSGFKFYFDTSVDTTAEESVSSILYRFVPMTLAYNNSGNTTVVVDEFGNRYNDVSLKTAAVNPSTSQDLALESIVFENYPESGEGALDFDLHVYSENVEAIVSAVAALEPAIPASADPFLVNILEATDINNVPYDHFVVDPASAGVINPDITIFLEGGSDGDVSLSGLETLIQSYLSGDNTMEFQDYYRYPFTHVYDSGFSLPTKYAMMNIYSLRDDVNITWWTQDLLTNPKTANTAAEDQSAGSAILSRVRTYPESTDFGTGVIRGEIYQQAGWLATTTGYTNGIVATSLDRLIKRCTYYSGTFIKGTPKGRPNNEVKLFRKISWTAAGDTQKQLNWDSSLNTISYADLGTPFYPDLISVHPDTTSLLSDGVFVDYIIFLKHIARNKWTYYVGRNDSITKLADTISKDIDNTIATVFKGLITTTTTVTQTEADLSAGDTATITIAVRGSMPNRIWNVILPVSRAAVPSASSLS